MLCFSTSSVFLVCFQTRRNERERGEKEREEREAQNCGPRWALVKFGQGGSFLGLRQGGFGWRLFGKRIFFASLHAFNASNDFIFFLLF